MYKILSIFFVFVFSSIRFAECGIKVYADEQLNEDCLYVHNKYRALHENTPPLKISRNATDQALARIRALAKIDAHKPHDSRATYGENFYWYYDSKQYHNCEHAVNLWYNGKQHYDFNRPGFSDKTGGFTQVLWKSSQYLGCATVLDNTRNYMETYFVCSYWPPGNVDREYPYNVFPIKRAGSHGSGSSVVAEHDPERPTVNRPDAHKPINPPVVRPPEPPEPSRPTVNRPSAAENWVEPSKPATDWTSPSRPIQQQQQINKPILGMPPVPPTYPLILLHPLFK